MLLSCSIANQLKKYLSIFSHCTVAPLLKIRVEIQLRWSLSTEIWGQKFLIYALNPKSLYGVLMLYDLCLRKKKINIGLNS